MLAAQQFHNLSLQRRKPAQPLLIIWGQVIRHLAERREQFIERFASDEAAEHDIHAVVSTGQIMDGTNATAAVRSLQELHEVLLAFGLSNLHQQVLRVIKGERFEWDLLEKTKEWLTAISHGFEELLAGGDETGEWMIRQDCPQCVLTLFANPFEQQIQVFNQNHQPLCFEAGHKAADEDCRDFGRGLIEQFVEPCGGKFGGIPFAERSIDPHEKLDDGCGRFIFVEPCDPQGGLELRVSHQPVMQQRYEM